MKKNNFLIIAGLSFSIGITGACSSGAPTNRTTADTVQTANTANTANAAATNETAHQSAGETPASVKNALPAAQSLTIQHRDIPPAAITSIEKETGGKVPDADHHSYLAFQTENGRRAQIGAATVVAAGGRELTVVYENKNGMPTIREIRADGIAADFLKQFAGKNHDAEFRVGADVKTVGVDEATAKTIAQAVRIDALTMQALYGAAHSH